MNEFLKSLPILYSGIFGLLGGLIAAFFAYKSKKTEMKYNAEIKARELLYKTYEQKLKKHNERMETYSGIIGKMQGAINTEESEIIFFKQITPVILNQKKLLKKSSLIEMKNELKKLEIYQENMEYYNDYSKDFIKVISDDGSENTKELFFTIESMLNNESVLVNAILEEKSEKLFSKYLKD